MFLVYILKAPAPRDWFWVRMFEYVQSRYDYVLIEDKHSLNRFKNDIINDIYNRSKQKMKCLVYDGDVPGRLQFIDVYAGNVENKDIVLTICIVKLRYFYELKAEEGGAQ